MDNEAMLAKVSRTRIESVRSADGVYFVARPTGYRLKPYPPVVNVLGVGLEVCSELLGWLRNRFSSDAEAWWGAEIDGNRSNLTQPERITGVDEAKAWIRERCKR